MLTTKGAGNKIHSAQLRHSGLLVARRTGNTKRQKELKKKYSHWTKTRPWSTCFPLSAWVTRRRAAKNWPPVRTSVCANLGQNKRRIWSAVRMPNELGKRRANRVYSSRRKSRIPPSKPSSGFAHADLEVFVVRVGVLRVRMVVLECGKIPERERKR